MALVWSRKSWNKNNAGILGYWDTGIRTMLVSERAGKLLSKEAGERIRKRADEQDS